MLVEASAVGHHATPAVVAVGVSNTGAESWSVVLGVGENVGCSTNVAKAVEGWLCSIAHAAALERLVHTANHRVVETAASCIVEVDAVDVGLAVLVVVATDAEAHSAEVVVGGLVVGIVGRAGQCAHLLGITLFVF